MILDIVLDNAFRQCPNMSDEEFIEMCLKGPDFTRKLHIVNHQEKEECMIMDD